MPQLNKSEAVHQRSRLLIERLVAFANYELTDVDHLEGKISVRWVEAESSAPRLIVKTQIRFLAALIAPTVTPKVKTHLKQDLRTLKDFLGLLEDNRDRTQGTGLWHFTLKLWHKSIEKNLIAFDEHWQQCKALDKQTPKPAALLPASPQETAKGHDISQMIVDERSPLHNLPPRDYGTFIGRADNLQQLSAFLSVDHPAARISLIGVGGIGKTALALEAAHRCLQPSQLQTLPKSKEGDKSNVTGPAFSMPSFAAIIFTSAKAQQFTPQGILPSYRYSQTLQDIFRTIAKTLKCAERLAGNFERQRETVYDMLSQQRSLLIIDNLEALSDQSCQAVLSFLYELPATVKVMVTSRVHITLDAVIPLQSLTPAEGNQFIQHQAALKAVTLDDAACKTVYQQTGGMPAAIVYAMGQVAAGYPATTVLPQLTQQTNDYCRYYLESTVNALYGQPAYDILIALSLFPVSASGAALVYITQMSEQDSVEGFASLKQLSLVTNQNERYTMLPLARDYLASLQKVSQQNDVDSVHQRPYQEYRQRWLTWYQEWLRPHQHQNWREWHDYALIDAEWENIQTVVEWTISTNCCSEFEQLWAGLKGYTHLRGYWNERFSWLEWWLSALRQPDIDIENQQSASLEALRDFGWTLVLMGQPAQLNTAEQYFQQAWERCSKANPSMQLDLAIDYAVLFLFQNQLEQADTWLRTAEQLLPQVEDAALQQIRIDYYTAQLRYRQNNDDAAKVLYLKILSDVEVSLAQQNLNDELKAQQQQIKVYSLNWLVDIELKAENVKTAERLLEQSWDIIQHQDDKRSRAFHQRSKAQLEKLRDRPSEFRHWCLQAQESFRTLGMYSNVQEMQSWLTEDV